MAHGYSNPVHNMICTKTFEVLVRKENGEFIPKTFAKGEKVSLDSFYGFYSDNPTLPDNKYWHRLTQEQIERVEPENIFYELDESYYGDYLYIDKGAVERSFRPIVHKHLAAMECSNMDSLNYFLKTLPVDNLKDVKELSNGNFLVIYVDTGDE